MLLHGAGAGAAAQEIRIAPLEIDLSLRAQLFGRLRAWTVVVANLLAASTMTWYLWKRHPAIRRGLAHVWDRE